MDADTRQDVADAGDDVVDKPLADEGYTLMGAVFEVHRELGGGLLEEVYQEALSIEFELRSIPFVTDEQLRIFYKDRLLRKWYTPDFRVFGRIVLEIKSIKQLLPEHEAQLINYMRITRQTVGYLVNFGPIGKVEWKRFVISEFINS
jgi:GxxExxY protein